jgi:hypothetical protein
MSSMLDTPLRRHPQAVADLVSLINGGAMAQALSVAAELGIPDLLAHGPKQAEEMARATETHAPSLRRLLKALSSVGACRECDDGSFALGPIGTLVRSDTSESLRSWVVWFGRYQWPMWGNLLGSIKTGESARKAAYGTDGFGHLERDSEAAAVFDSAMVQLSCLVAAEVARTYDFKHIRSIVDVGGGRGALLHAILEAYPDVQGTVLDRPRAFADGDQWQNRDFGDRCTYVGGDFFHGVPHEADVYLLKNIIHDWDDDRATLILRNCRAAIPPRGKLLLVERIMPERVEAAPRHRNLAWSDLAMLIGPGGRERTEAEFRALLRAADFELRKVISTAVEFSILEALPGGV